MRSPASFTAATAEATAGSLHEVAHAKAVTWAGGQRHEMQGCRLMMASLNSLLVINSLWPPRFICRILASVCGRRQLQEDVKGMGRHAARLCSLALGQNGRVTASATRFGLGLAST
jgi:hypothetical protein